LGYRGYFWIGVVSGAIAFLFVPPVFGLLSVICGVQIYRRFNELHGILVGAWGGVALIIGMIIGAMGGL
jgi:asparagine N-glycosylation enzyme membrane subunit Stt3